jgi:hypothetical protein
MMTTHHRANVVSNGSPPATRIGGHLARDPDAGSYARVMIPGSRHDRISGTIARTMLLGAALPAWRVLTANTLQVLDEREQFPGVSGDRECMDYGAQSTQATGPGFTTRHED